MRADPCSLAEADRAPVVIGGLGGSGTRLVTQVLQREGVVFGGAMNESLDNLWFTLLFVRRSILLTPADEVRQLAWLFTNAMRHAAPVPTDLAGLLERAARHDRGPALRRTVLAAARDSLLASDAPAAGAPRWGWKQPNSHVMVSQLLDSFPAMKYVYVVRNGLDMALGYNQNQLMYFWGDVMLDGDTSPGPRNALRYWVTSYRRLQADARRFPGQVYVLDYDALCRSPKEQLLRLNDFLGLQAAPPALERAQAIVSVPDTTGRRRDADLRQFDAADLAFLEEAGFDIGP